MKDNIMRHIRPLDLPEDKVSIHFDIEDYPLTEDGKKCVYLWGFVLPEDYSDDSYEYVWVDHPDHDRDGWQGFLELVESFRERYGDALQLVHFSQHEHTTIKE